MPKVHFTARAVDSLKSTDTQIDYFDSHLTGLAIRVSASGVKTWNFIYRYQSRLRRLKLGRYPDLTLADARRAATAAKGSLAKGLDPAASRDSERSSDTFGELATAYIERYAKPRKRTWREDQRLLSKDFLPRWGSRKLISITTVDVRHEIQRIQSRARRGIIANHALSLLRTLFDFGVQHQYVETNPCGRLRMPVPTVVRERVLSFDEIVRVWKFLQSRHQLSADVLGVQLFTGQRVGEVMSMGWADIDLQSEWWTIPAERAKNNRKHRVPLNGLAADILTRRRLTESGVWVFPGPQTPTAHVLLPTIQRYVVALRDVIGDSSTHDL